MKKVNFIKASYILLSALVVIFGIFFYRSVFGFLGCSFVVAYFLSPLVRFLERRGLGRTWGIVLIYTLLIIVFAGSSYFLIPAFVVQIQNFTQTITQIYEDNNISYILTDVINNKDIRLLKQMELFKNNPSYLDIFSRYFDDINQVIASPKFQNFAHSAARNFDNWLNELVQTLWGTLRKLFDLVSYVSLVPIISFFLIKDAQKIKQAVYDLIPNRYFEMTIRLTETADGVVGTYLRAMMTEVIVIAVLSSIALSAVGVSYSILIGIMVGLANMIPYFGPILGYVFATASVLLTGKPPALILYACLGLFIVQALDNMLVYPLVMGKNMNMHPLVIMLTVVAGGYVFGILGMFLSVPILYLTIEIMQVLYISLKGFKII